MTEKHVGLIGATSLVGQCLIPQLVGNGWTVRAFSRRWISSDDSRVLWTKLPYAPAETTDSENRPGNIPFWICAASLWILPGYFPMLEKFGARRMIAVSSTSLFTKNDSANDAEKATALKLSDAENQLKLWAESASVDWLVLRPTMIYGLGRDKNVSEMMRLIRRLGFFPLLGQARGLRQPVHAEDVAFACLAALSATGIANRAYNLSGGETLSYQDMVGRLFSALGRRPGYIRIPLWFFSAAVAVMRRIPRYRDWTMQMAERMNTDLVFDHSEAVRDLNYAPRPFRLTSKDLPV